MTPFLNFLSSYKFPDTVPAQLRIILAVNMVLSLFFVADFLISSSIQDTLVFIQNLSISGRKGVKQYKIICVKNKFKIIGKTEFVTSVILGDTLILNKSLISSKINSYRLLKPEGISEINLSRHLFNFYLPLVSLLIFVLGFWIGSHEIYDKLLYVTLFITFWNLIFILFF